MNGSNGLALEGGAWQPSSERLARRSCWRIRSSNRNRSGARLRRRRASFRRLASRHCDPQTHCRVPADATGRNHPRHSVHRL